MHNNSLHDLLEFYDKPRNDFPLLDIFQKFQKADYSGAMKYTMTSPEIIRNRSFGEVERPESMNIKTNEPLRGGLFCQKIFGPIKEYECSCGKYKGFEYRGFLCEECGVEVNRSSLRNERMGHIELAAPCVNIWFVKVRPSILGRALDILSIDIERILYFEAYIVTNPGLAPIGRYSILSEDDVDAFTEEYGSEFEAKTGAEAIKYLLKNFDFEYEIQRCKKAYKSEAEHKKNAKRLLLLEMLLEKDIKPEWMVLDAIPVIPPNWRPLGPLIDGQFEASDFNRQYQKIITTNDKLKRMIGIKAPPMFLNSLKLELQNAVDCLLDNNLSRMTMIGANTTPLRSLASLD